MDLLDNKLFYKYYIENKTLKQLNIVLDGIRMLIDQAIDELEAKQLDHYALIPADVRLFLLFNYLDMMPFAINKAGGKFKPSLKEQEADHFESKIYKIIKIEIKEIIDGITYFYQASINGRYITFIKKVDDESETIKSNYNTMKTIKVIRRLHLGYWQDYYSYDNDSDPIIFWEVRFIYKDDIKPKVIKGINKKPFNYDSLKKLFEKEYYM